MSFAEQMDADFLDFDGLEEVTFIARRTTDGVADDTEYRIDYALPAQVSHREQSLGNVLQAGAVARVWNIRKCDFEELEITPREGDVIKQDDETEWTIESLDLRSLNTRYRFVCTLGRE